jgi:hypothetical protein
MLLRATDYGVICCCTNVSHSFGVTGQLWSGDRPPLHIVLVESMSEPPKCIRYYFHRSIFTNFFLVKREKVMFFDESHNASCISFVTSFQDQTILHFSLTTTPQSFLHFERTLFGSIGDPFAYCTVILIMHCCILSMDLISLSWLFLGLGCFSCVTKALSS